MTLTGLVMSSLFTLVSASMVIDFNSLYKHTIHVRMKIPNAFKQATAVDVGLGYIDCRIQTKSPFDKVDRRIGKKRTSGEIMRENISLLMQPSRVKLNPSDRRVNAI